MRRVTPCTSILLLLAGLVGAGTAAVFGFGPDSKASPRFEYAMFQTGGNLTRFKSAENEAESKLDGPLAIPEVCARLGLKVDPKKADIITVFDHLGSQSWELVAVSNAGSVTTWIFKRAR